jgi:hypothetical protein
MPEVQPTGRWTTDQVLAHAPDPAVRQAARTIAASGRWADTGAATDPPGVWGAFRGSARTPYQVCVDLTEPAYHCSCPSRKLPCKHALGLMLLWAGGEGAGGGVAPAEPPQWFTDWQQERTTRRERAAARRQTRVARRAEGDAEPVTATQVRRAGRVDAGIDELDRWLGDQMRQGIAGAGRVGYRHWDAMAERLVDAQAPALASGVRRLAAFAGAPDRLLAELGLLRLAVTGWRQREHLPADLVDNVRSRIGFPVTVEEVLDGDGVRDDWVVIGIRDEVDRRLNQRRVWLRGEATDRDALVLSFAPPGTPLPGEHVLGTRVDADLCFYPGRGNLRALVRTRYAEPLPVQGPPPGSATIAEALARYARSLADNPWQDRTPMLLDDVTIVSARPASAIVTGNERWHVVDRDGAALVLYPPIEQPWRLVAAAGGTPATVAGEWTTDGLRPLSMWTDGRLVTA